MLKNILIAVNLVGLIALGVYTLAFQSQKNAYFINQELFNAFKGKQELENRLNALKTLHKTRLDSMATMVQSNASTIEQYRQLAEGFQLEENDLSNRYSVEIWKKLNKYVAEYGRSQGYAYVFGATGDGGLMYASEDNNITTSIIEYANKQYEQGE